MVIQAAVSKPRELAHVEIHGIPVHLNRPPVHLTLKNYNPPSFCPYSRRLRNERLRDFKYPVLHNINDIVEYDAYDFYPVTEMGIQLQRQSRTTLSQC